MALAANLEREEQYFSSGVAVLAGMDEVGRGALAGPVGVGLSLLRAGTGLGCLGLKDSKLLTARQRQLLLPDIQSWIFTSVAYASAAEIDQLGIILALRLAGQRVLAQACRQAGQTRPDLLLLDGKHNWLSEPAAELLPTLDSRQQLYTRLLEEAWASQEPWFGPVQTIVKGDQSCASIAAASIVAKVDRDKLMTDLNREYPGYDWDKNKGYGSAAHRRQLAQRGPSPQHRLSWKIGAGVEKDPAPTHTGAAKQRRKHE